MYLINTKYLIPKGYRGIAIFPFILFKYKHDKHDITFLNHEKIHLRQQLELLIIPFFISYFFEFLWKSFKYRNFHLGYRNISFEREAYLNEKNTNYLTHRKIFGFLSYINKPKN